VSEPVVHEQTPARTRWIIYAVFGAVALILAVIGLATFRHEQASESANAKADELIAALEEAGLTPPDRDQIIRVLGDDGGAMCEDPGSALNQAISNQLASNGASGPGQRPGPVAAHTIQGEILALQIYCPDQLPDFLDYVNGLDLEDLRRA
jgi:hypothetical protein